MKVEIVEPSVLNYDPDGYPADIRLARLHGKATRIGLTSQDLNQEVLNQRLCPCCGLEIDTLPIPVCGDRELFNSLGSAYPQFFEFMKMSLLLVFLGIIVFSITTMIQNNMTDDCLSEESETYKKLSKYCPQSNMEPCNDGDQNVIKICKYWNSQVIQIEDSCCSEFCEYKESSCILGGLNNLNYPNKQFNENRKLIQCILSLILTMMLVICIHFIRYRIRLSIDELDRGVITASDYAIIIRNLPFGQYNESQLIDFLHRNAAPPIAKVVIGYDILRYSDLCKQRQKMIGEKIKVQTYLSKKGVYPKKYNQKSLNNLLKKIQELSREIENIEYQTNSLTPSSTAIVIFLKQEGERHEIILEVE